MSHILRTTYWIFAPVATPQTELLTSRLCRRLPEQIEYSFIEDRWSFLPPPVWVPPTYLPSMFYLIRSHGHGLCTLESSAFKCEYFVRHLPAQTEGSKPPLVNQGANGLRQTFSLCSVSLQFDWTQKAHIRWLRYGFRRASLHLRQRGAACVGTPGLLIFSSWRT